MSTNHDIAVYAGYVKEKESLLKSASGGIATAISEEIINRGGYVAGVSYTEDFHGAEYTITNNLSDLDRLRGSKYIEVNKGTVYKDVRNLLDKGKTVLFFGLPCTVAAMYSFLGKEYDNLITCELICHAPISTKVHEQYVAYLEEKYNSTLCSFSVRYKKKGWTPPYLRAEFKNGQIFEDEFYSTEYGIAFRNLMKPSCFKCQFKGDNRTGDLMIGDFWGASKTDPFWNDNGISVMFVHTQKADELLRSIKDIELFESTFDRAVEHNSNVLTHRKINESRIKFSKLFEKKGLFYAAKHYVPVKKKIKSFIAHLIPKQSKSFLKKIIGKK